MVHHYLDNVNSSCNTNISKLKNYKINKSIKSFKNELKSKEEYQPQYVFNQIKIYRSKNNSQFKRSDENKIKAE
jgi:hypothetical protein